MDKKPSFKININKVNTLEAKNAQELDPSLPQPSPRLAQQMSAGRRNSLADAMDVLKLMKLKVKERRNNSARREREHSSERAMANGNDEHKQLDRRSVSEPKSLDEAMKRSKLQPRARAPHPNPSPRSFSSSISTDLDDESSDNEQPVTDRSKRSTPPRGEHGNGTKARAQEGRVTQSGAKSLHVGEQGRNGSTNGMGNGYGGVEEEDELVGERTTFETVPRRREQEGFQNTTVCEPKGNPSNDVLDVTEIRKVAHSVVQDVLGNHPDYKPAAAIQWMSTITKEGISRLAKLGFPFKFIVTSFVCERNEKAGIAGIGGVSTASACKWNTMTDGSVTVLWYGASVYCITTVYGIHF